MNRSILIITLAFGSLGSFAQAKKPVTAKPAIKPSSANIFKNNIDSVSYAVGVRIAQSLKVQGFNNVNMAMFQKAMNDIAQSKTPVLGEAAISECIGKFQQKLNAGKESEQQKENAVKGMLARKEGQAFLEANSKRQGVVTLPSGLQYEILKAGTENKKPTLASKVTCHYVGTLINGTKFESSVDRGTPIVYPVANFIRGWQEGLQLMTVGSKWKFFIPADLAYGDNGPPAIGPGAALIFELELLAVEN